MRKWARSVINDVKDFERKRIIGAVSGSATSSKRYGAFHTVPKKKQPVSPRYGLRAQINVIMSRQSVKERTFN